MATRAVRRRPTIGKIFHPALLSAVRAGIAECVLTYGAAECDGSHTQIVRLGDRPDGGLTDELRRCRSTSARALLRCWRPWSMRPGGGCRSSTT
jgi:hypothetical protein